MTAVFKVPPTSPLGKYDLQSSGAIWRIRVNEGQHGRIALYGAPGARVRSNNPTVIPNDASVFSTTETHGYRVVEFFGLSSGTSMIEVRDGSDDVVTNIHAHVESIGGQRAFFQLAQPSMAPNA